MHNKFIKLFSLIATAFVLSFSAAHAGNPINMYGVSIENQGELYGVKAGETFNVEATYEITHKFPYGPVQFIAGYHEIGAQVCIIDALSQSDGEYTDMETGENLTKGMVNFTMTAPETSGQYEIRYRYAQANDAEDAVTYWWNVDVPPGEDSILGTIVVE